MFLISPLVAYDSKHFGLDRTASAQFPAKQKIISAAEVGYNTARLLHKESACSHIPRVEVVFKESFKSPTCNVGKVRGGTAQATNTMGIF